MCTHIYRNESQIYPKNCEMWQITYSSPVRMDLYLVSLYCENIYRLEGLEHRLWRYSLDLRSVYATYLISELKWTLSVCSLVPLLVKA